RSRPVGGVTVWCLGAGADPASEVVARRMRMWGGARARVDRTDEDGAFECQVSAGDESRVLVPGVPSSEQRVPAGVDRVTLVIPVHGRLRGSVRDVDDRPVPAFGIELQPAAGGAGYERAFISADGTFEIEDIVANRYEVVAARPGFPPSPPATVDIRPGATAEVTLILRKGLTVRGTVLDAVTRRPISGARISAPRLGRLPGPVADPEVFVTTDGYGRFEISRVLLVGASSMTVSAPGYNDWVLGIREAELEEVTIELTPAAVDAGTEFGGVGMGMNGQLLVTLVHPAGPAARAGIVVGDRITRIDGRTPEDLEDAISRIRGPLGTQVEIQLRRADGGVLDTRLRRERIAAVP
ncbi:MAG TPA: carboxypeptidase regulatory-like domain-containing protein, partial [Myxococcales bacterium]|nr:carboxypeptidase regulatory-like domain-containing protein [Myxococcales bacterium]